MWIRELTDMSHFEPGACLSLLPTEECEWSTWDIWRSSDIVQRAIYLGLALMLCYTFFVFTRFLFCYYRRRHELHDYSPGSGTDILRSRRTLISRLGQGLEILKGISTAAPFLGLAGTSYGILAGLWFSYSGSPERLVTLLLTRIAFAFVPTLAGIIVAVPATICCTLLRTQIERFSTDPFSIGQYATDGMASFQFARTLPLRKRFSGLPPLAVLAAPLLACVGALFTPFHPYRIPTGLAVALPNAYCQHDAVDRLVVLSITNEDKLFINTESLDWMDLRSRLSTIYATRAEKVLYLRAEDGVSLQRVRNAIDIARNSPASDSVHITVALVTPSVARGCVPIRVRTIPTKRGFR